MKTSTGIIALTLLVASVVSGFSADQRAPAKAKPVAAAKAVKARKSAAKPHGTEQVALTGSYIKREVRRNGIVTDGPYDVVVLDNEAIRNSGAADLRQLLVLRGLSR